MVREAKRFVKLTFSQELIQEPVIYTMAKKFNIMPNIRRARVTKEIGEVVLEIEGDQQDLEKGIDYLTGMGVIVEPVVGDIIE